MRYSQETTGAFFLAGVTFLPTTFAKFLYFLTHFRDPLLSRVREDRRLALFASKQKNYEQTLGFLFFREVSAGKIVHNTAILRVLKHTECLNDCRTDLIFRGLSIHSNAQAVGHSNSFHAVDTILPERKDLFVRNGPAYKALVLIFFLVQVVKTTKQTFLVGFAGQR